MFGIQDRFLMRIVSFRSNFNSQRPLPPAFNLPPTVAKAETSPLRRTFQGRNTALGTTNKRDLSKIFQDRQRSSKMSTSIAVVDSTVQLEWEITKEAFDNFDFGQVYESPLFNVKIDKQESKWNILLYPKGNEEAKRNKVRISLRNRGAESKVVKFDFTVLTQNKYWPTDPVKKSYAIQNDIHPKVVTFQPKESWGSVIGSTEVVSGKFYNNKMTIVATLVIFGKGQKYLEHKQAATDFVINSRAISDLDDLSNITLVCQGKRIKCHKIVLASMSSFFKTKFTNGNFSDGRVKVVNIDDSTSEIVEKMVKFLMSGLIPDDIGETAKELLKLSTFYGIDSLTAVCEKVLVKNLSPQNVIETFIYLDKYLPASENRQDILKFMKANKNEVVASPDFITFCTNHPNLVVEMCKSL